MTPQKISSSLREWTRRMVVERQYVVAPLRDVQDDRDAGAERHQEDEESDRSPHGPVR